MTIKSDELVAVPAQAPDTPVPDQDEHPPAEAESSAISDDDEEAQNAVELELMKTWAVMRCPDKTEVYMPTAVAVEDLDEMGNPRFSIGTNRSGTHFGFFSKDIQRYCELTPRSPSNEDDPQRIWIIVRPLDGNGVNYQVDALLGSDVVNSDDGSCMIRGAFMLALFDNSGDAYEVLVTPSGRGFLRDTCIGASIGSGGQGKVFKAFVKRPSPSFPIGTMDLAVKVSKRLDDEETQAILAIIEAGPTEHVLTIFQSNCAEESLFTVIAMECMVGNLTQCLPTMRAIDIKNLCRQLLEGLHFIHQVLKLLHGDLKALNALVNGLNISDPKFKVKWADFGCSKKGDEKRLAETFSASLAHCAPEIDKKHRHFNRYEFVDGYKTDYFALGKTIFYVIDGRTPSHKDCIIDVSKKHVIALAKKVEHGADADGETNFAQFLMSFLAIDPNERPTPRQGLDHPWLSGKPKTSARPKQNLKRGTAVAFGPAKDGDVVDEARPEKRGK